MAGLVPAIRVFGLRKDVDTRQKAGHDEAKGDEQLEWLITTTSRSTAISR